MVAARACASGLLAAGALAAAAAGCGGSGGDQAVKQDFIAKANRICADGNSAIRPLARQIKAAQQGSDADKVYADLARLTRRSVQTSTPYVSRLDALDAPAPQRDALKSWIADLRRQQALLGQLSAAFGRQDQAAVPRLAERIDALGRKGNAFAKRFGMAECARNA